MKNNLQKNRLTARSTKLDLDYNVEMQKLKIATIKSELADQEQLLDVGGISPARVAKTRQELVIAEKEFETIEQRNSIRMKQISADEDGLILQITIKEKEIGEKKANLQKTIVRTPSAGIILNIHYKEGEKFGSGDQLVHISNMSSFKINAYINESNAEMVKTGGEVIAQLKGESLSGKIGRIHPVIENNRVNFEVFLDNNDHNALIPNMKIILKMIRTRKDSVIRIPSGEALTKADNQFVFVVEGNKAIRKEITTGLKGTDYIEILSGMSPGETVILSDISASRAVKELDIEN
jgi:HlyD family secretion protein